MSRVTDGLLPVANRTGTSIHRCPEPLSDKPAGSGDLFRRKAKVAHPLRYLVYVSDSKIEMLLTQIPEPVRRALATELKIDLKLVSLKVTRAAASNDTRVSRLAVVERHLEANHTIGGLDTTGGYFRATVDMDWAVLDDGIVLFAGRSGEQLVFLGGSTSNLTSGSHLAPGLGSHASVIQQKLAALVSGADQRQLGDTGRHAAAAFMEVVKSPQRAEFLARHLASGKVEQPSVYRTYIVGTPLFVELVNEADA
jgi:hypothetical protein